VAGDADERPNRNGFREDRCWLKGSTQVLDECLAMLH
jgi:hypothetical protein